ncbi:MAG: ATP-dependent DNA helicase RecG [Anaerolineales bacterium]|nr:MAG: ATP-dependent DNA helicase RecG [Anaerolineales bacterium]
MPTPWEKLAAILRQEAERCEDKVVMGGLARYADTWRQEADAALGKEGAPWIERVSDHLAAYGHLPDDSRRQAIDGLLETMIAGPPVQPVQKSSSVSRPAAAGGAPRGLDSEITAVRGIGTKQASRLAKLGVRSIRDLLYFFPRRYDDYSQLSPINRVSRGEEVTIIAKVWDIGARRTRRGLSLVKATLSDGTGFVEATWFNQPYLVDRIKRGQQIVVSGKVDPYQGHLCFSSPTWELLEEELLHTARIVPVYPLTEGLSSRWLRGVMKRTIDYWSKRLPDHLPASIREKAGLVGLESAIAQIHFPNNDESLRQARHRLSFDELFILQVGLLQQRRLWRSQPAKPLPVNESQLEAFISTLPFQLTGAQQRSLNEIAADLRSEKPMNRLLQGDVGSGKTAVAAAAMALAAAAGAQAALMAPTEILAQQHFRSIGRLLEQMPGTAPTIRLLTGSVTGPERDEIYDGLKDGSISIAIGTHALIQQAVEFNELALAVIDEQHRFGVRERSALRQKGYNPHLLVMTATPIPRSLELTVWGHLDVSVIDEMPPGRKAVVTRLMLPAERERAYAFVRSQVEKGHQAFVIYPLVEESEKIDAKAAVEEHERLRKEVFPDLRLGLLHGRLKSEEKEATMASFASGELDILVATSVVEVGVDVPNATVMLVEGAERFGLAQLHQFRGRVGRSGHESYCILVSSTSSDETNERLLAIEATSDGFELAEKDLQLRGPGEFLGTRQSGLPDLQLAAVTDVPLIKAAREAAKSFFETDPELANPDHRLLAQHVARLWRGEGDVS